MMMANIIDIATRRSPLEAEIAAIRVENARYFADVAKYGRETAAAMQRERRPDLSLEAALERLWSA